MQTLPEQSQEPTPSLDQAFEAPKLAVFVPPQLMRCGDLTEFTGALFGTFSP